MGKTLERQALDCIGKDWSKSSATREKLLANVGDFTRFVQDKFGLERIINLKPGHVEAYAQNLQQRGLSASDRANKMTAVRQVADSIGKQNIVARKNKEYGIERVRINPQPVNSEKLDVIRGKLRDKADRGDKIALMMITADMLRKAFGLRAKESLMSKDVTEESGKLFLVVEGAKGGRPRSLEVKNDAQLCAVQQVKETSRLVGSGTGRIIPPNMTLKQAYDAQRNEWRTLGGTRAAEANMHGERHSVARELNAAGVPKTEIMRELGHGETRSPAAYLGKNS